MGLCARANKQYAKAIMQMKRIVTGFVYRKEILGDGISFGVPEIVFTSESPMIERGFKK